MKSSAAVSSPIARALGLSHIELNKLHNVGSVWEKVNSQIRTLCGAVTDLLEPLSGANIMTTVAEEGKMNGTVPKNELSQGLPCGAPGVDDEEHMMPNS